MREILYRSDRLEVRRIAAGDGRRQVVTFDPYHDAPGLDRPGFGEAHFAKSGITAIHLLTHGNDWYQYPNLPDALAAVRAAAAGAERRLAYGSSMGGYAAIRFAGAVGADAVMALSPQYSIDPRKVRFEPRWRQEQSRVRFLPALEGRIRFGGQVVLAFDPLVPADRLHADRIAAEVAVERLLLPHAGHPAGPFLAETSLLAAMVEEMLEGTFDLAATQREAHRRRALSPTRLGYLALAQPAHRRRCAVALAGRAAAISPLDPAVLDRLALCQAAARDFEAAIATHRRVLELERLPNYLWGYSKTLFAAAMVPEALAVARELQAIAPSIAGHHRWAADITLALGDRRAALADLRAAIRHAPANRGYRWAALKLAWRLRFGQG